jgi:transglutaminase-like putative cysteine protease
MAEIPTDTLSFILPSRYCEVDSGLLDFAWKRFAAITPGRAWVQAICGFVHSHLRFDYQMARSNQTAVDAFKKRVGVCRAWFEVYLGGRWYSFDARHNQRRIGRIVIGRGRDAADVPITMVFGSHQLEKFSVMTEDVKLNDNLDRGKGLSFLQEATVETI